MTAPKSLPSRPSPESLVKQAKKIARECSVSLRNAQLALAREYGFAGWRDLTAEVSKRVGNDFEWALAEARRGIHDNDVVVVKRLLAEHPALLSWQGDERHQSRWKWRPALTGMPPARNANTGLRAEHARSF